MSHKPFYESLNMIDCYGNRSKMILVLETNCNAYSVDYPPSKGIQSKISTIDTKGSSIIFQLHSLKGNERIRV